MDPNLNNKYLESYYPKVVSEIKGFAIFMMDPEGIISTWNTGCEQLKGYSSEEAVGMNYEFLFPDFLRDQDHPVKELEEAKNHGRAEAEHWRRKKNGELFWAYIVLTKITDEDGKHIGFAKITQDLSNKKKLEDELRTKNHDLVRINKDLDNFVHTASHDLKAPINNIGGLTTALYEEFTKEVRNDSEMFAIIDLIIKSVSKFKQVISEMASTKEEQSEQFIYQSFKEITQEIKDNLHLEIKDSNAIIIEDFSEAPTVRFPRKNIRSILHNLISNAIKYRSPERAPKIFIRTMYEEAFTVLEISDNGKGIKDVDKKKVFAMYHRLEEQNVEGTGIGLAIVSRIVDDSGGKIEIDSKYGEWTQFRVYIKSIPVGGT